MCEMYFPSLNNDNCFSIPVASSGVNILVVTVRSNNYIQAKCSEIAASDEILCSQLHTLNDPCFYFGFAMFPQ